MREIISSSRIARKATFSIDITDSRAVFSDKNKDKFT